MKATISIEIEEIPDTKEVTISITDPKLLQSIDGPVKIAVKELIPRIGNAIKEFYDDVKTLFKHKPQGASMGDLEVIGGSLRIIRTCDRYDITFKTADLKDVRNTKFKEFATNVVLAIENALDEVNKEQYGFKNKYKQVSDSALKKQAWAMRN